MTEELQHSLEMEMKDALRIEDAEHRHDAILTVLVHQNEALIDCQRKTADRVKTLVQERESVKERVKGAKLLIDALKLIASAGGTAAIIKFLNVV
jgi:hypothetical protein